MADIGGAMLTAIKERFTRAAASDKIASSLIEQILNGNADFAQVEEYAARIGELASNAILTECKELIAPGTQLTKELLEPVLREVLGEAYELITGASADVMEKLLREAKLGLKPVKPAIDTDRLEGLVDKACSYDSFQEAEWVLEDPVVNFTQNVADRFLRENVKTHFNAGLLPKVTRKAEGGCCKWCRALAGTYEYPVEREVYQRHENCRCLVLYDPGDGKVQNVHTKKEYDSVKEAEEADKAERRRKKLEKWEKESARYPEARREILRRIKSGEYSLKLKHQKYLQHTENAAQYKNATGGRGRHQSYLIINEKEVQTIIDRYSGLGDPDISKTGEVEDREFFSTGRIIGYYFDGEQYRPTDRVAICHSEDGSHIFPVRPLEIEL